MSEETTFSYMPPEKAYRKLFGLEIYLTPVFVISSIAILVFVIGTLIFQESATRVFTNTRVWLTTNLDWLFLISINLVLLFCIFVAFSSLGKVRFGGPDAKPEFSYLTWIAMLFKETLLPLWVHLWTRFGACSGISFIDSTTLSVCDTRRISTHRVFSEQAGSLKTSMGWFYGTSNFIWSSTK